ncbi:MAG: SMI1/KNR4 family protein [Ruminococcaceae bacterium]|nr:SMI1/KNR4 family protein [Oscillospiraceae bacterium]
MKGENNMEWKYVSPLKDPMSVEAFEADYSVELPRELKSIVREYNGGWPQKRNFTMENGEEGSVKRFLSFNTEDKESVWTFNSRESARHGYTVFAIDSFGNYIALRDLDKKVIFVDNDIDEVTVIASDFNTFLKCLGE